MTAPRDPIGEWRDISRRAALATGYRSRPRAVARPTPLRSIGAVAVVVLIVVGGLALRAPSPSTDRRAPIVATTEDGTFRLELTTPQGTYRPEDAIEPVARVTYLGPKPVETMYHATQPVRFRIEEIGGDRVMGFGTTRLPCRSTLLANGASVVVPFGKPGAPTEDPNEGFDIAWYEDPVLKLPIGSWRIVAGLGVGIGDQCGSERHNLTVENIVRVVAGDAGTPTPSAITDGPVIATAEDPTFRLELATPRGAYRPEDAIEPVASVTYLGPRSAETMFHAMSPIGFRIEEVGGVRLMGGGMDQPCLSTDLAKGASAVIRFAKAGSPDDPKDGFDRAWYEDAVLRLPAGRWRIIAYLDVSLGACGGDHHELTVDNVVLVVAEAGATVR